MNRLFLILSITMLSCKEVAVRDCAAANEMSALTAAQPPIPMTVDTPPPVMSVKLPKMPPAAIELEMVYVQGGTFKMGSDGSDTDASKDEKPLHTVTLNSFFIGKYEITQAQWRAVMGTSPSIFKNCDNCPVEGVSWEDAQQFIHKLDSLSNKRYRLPTEAEWEYAAHGGSRSKSYKYSGSNDVKAVAWHKSTFSYSKTYPVGGKVANELGLFDMSGNVWEWCSDWYGEYYYSISPNSNPTGPANDKFSVAHVLRGGSWLSTPENNRVTSRLCTLPSDQFFDIGFRVVSFP